MTGADPEDALYAAPPDGFVAARDALAKQLRAAGDRAGAAHVRALRRPTRAAWAVNVTVREHPEAAQELTEAAGRLGDAQRELLAGGAPSQLRDAQARVDAACRTLLAAAPVDDLPTLEKVRQTLRAAAVDADALARVTSGRLLREEVASGFGDLGGFPSPPPRSPQAESDAEAAANTEAAAAAPAQPGAAETADAARAEQEAEERATREAAERRARIEQAREQEAAAETAAGATERALLDAEAAADQEQRALHDAEAVAEQARRALQEAEAAADQARRALQKADAAAASRRAEHESSEARLADAARAREQAEAS